MALDSYFYLHDPDFRGPMRLEVRAPFKLIGRWNLALIPLLMAGLIIPKYIFSNDEGFALWQAAFRIAILCLVIALSRKVTPPQVEKLNDFAWEPFKEVAIIFAAIFSTMIPAIKYLEANAASMNISSSWAFFWVTGALSGVLDNAPTYSAFFAVAEGLGKDFATVTLDKGRTISEPLLMALSCGSVFFGAFTYLGNGPNFLIKAVAEKDGVRMPSFFGYMLWSIGFLLPVLFLVGILFFE